MQQETFSWLNLLNDHEILRISILSSRMRFDMFEIVTFEYQNVLKDKKCYTCNKQDDHYSGNLVRNRAQILFQVNQIAAHNYEKQLITSERIILLPLCSHATALLLIPLENTAEKAP